MNINLIEHCPEVDTPQCSLYHFVSLSFTIDPTVLFAMATEAGADAADRSAHVLEYFEIIISQAFYLLLFSPSIPLGFRLACGVKAHAIAYPKVCGMASK